MDFLDYVKMCQEETTLGRKDGTKTKEERNTPMNQGMFQSEPVNSMNQGMSQSEPANSMNQGMSQSESAVLEQRRGPGCRGQLYKVQRGDTLYSISRKYNLRVRDLMQANPFVNVYNLQVGEELCIPVLMGDRPTPNTRPYIVKRTDTVLSILDENNLTFQQLSRLNRSAAVLKFPAGTVLQLPK